MHPRTSQSRRHPGRHRQGHLRGQPGIDEEAARRIINQRPYSDAYEMVKKHAITKAEYDKIAGKVTAK